MLAAFQLIGFALTANAAEARRFYEGKLGLRFVEEDGFALVLDSGGNMIRLAKTPEMTPARHTVLGWEVTAIEKVVAGLKERGVVFEQYPFVKDPSGIWTAPGGARIAWFKDPDGNVLSLSEHP